MNNEFNDSLPSEEQLLADLRRDFPKMHVRPVREYNDEYKHGAWVYGEDNCVMPDGKLVFRDPLYEDEDSITYERDCHPDFVKWNEERGWYCFQYDVQVFFIIPISENEAEVKEWNALMEAARSEREAEERSIDSSPNVHRISEAKGYKGYCPF
jgi:hypothetical protein